MESSFSKEIIFPIIGKIIDTELQIKDSIHRDEISQKLLEKLEGQKVLDAALRKYDTNDPYKVTGNMVDWFSAEITKESNLASPWLNKYARSRSRVNGRKIYVYSFKEQPFIEEFSESSSEALFEGATKKVRVNTYERNPKARTACINHYGTKCQCCGFDFYSTYGEIGLDFIHVHHLKLLSEIGETYQIDPIADLRPVCPNCHAMLHRRNPPFSIEELKFFIEKNKAEIDATSYLLQSDVNREQLLQAIENVSHEHNLVDVEIDS